MSKVVQVDLIRRHIPEFRHRDSALSIYYDETNNIRRLSLSEIGLNASADHTFALAGIALRPGQSFLGWEELCRSIGIQRSATEVKFKHVARPSYEEALTSTKLGRVLAWFLDNDILIHYSVLDVMYWSLIDIVESLIPESRLPIAPLHLQLKDNLYRAARMDPASFMSLLHKFGYPNLERVSVCQFLEAIRIFVEHHMAADDRGLDVLKQVLYHSTSLPALELPFLHDNEPGELIKDFSVHFLYRMYVFENASHTFDRETYIEKALQSLGIHEGEKRFQYRFSDSKDEAAIQASDIVAGLLGRHFTYVRNHTLPDLMQKRANFSNQQIRNLDLLQALIDRSDDFSEGLIHAVIPIDTHFKNSAFLHGIAATP